MGIIVSCNLLLHTNCLQNNMLIELLLTEKRIYTTLSQHYFIINMTI